MVVLSICAISFCVLLGLLFVRGRSLCRISERTFLSVFLFWGGLALFGLSSAWPIESFGQENFAVHQCEFLAIRIIAPMLIVLSRCGMTLLRGISPHLRHTVLAPVVSQEVFRRAWRTIRKPPVALLFYLASLYIWAIPALQDRALADSEIALLLHFSLFFAGLLFWSCIFEVRTGPRSATHGVRLMMLLLAMLGQIAIGSATSLKTAIWYPAYRGGLTDETVGGVFLWIPSSLLTLLGLLAVLHMWGQHETRLDLKRTAWSPSNSAILLYPETASALRAIAAPKNRRLALGLAAFVLFVFLATLAEGIGYRFS